MRYYITFTKTNNIRYISHLDLMRLFQRTFKRAGFAMRYSDGFNPHPKMSFAQPLSLGFVGLNEVLEFEVEDKSTLTAEQIPAAMNPYLPPGVSVNACVELPSGINVKQQSMSGITVSGDYLIFLETPEGWSGDPEKLTEDFLSQTSIQAMKRIKKTKKDEMVEIRPDILSLTYEETIPANQNVFGMPIPAGSLVFRGKLSCGSGHNLNPSVLLKPLTEFFGIPYDVTTFHIVRERLYFQE